MRLTICHHKVSAVFHKILPILLSFVVSIAVTTNQGHANPMGETVQAGTVTIDRTTPNVTQIQASDKAIIGWQTFNIGAQETTQFIQPSSQSIVLNRINGYNGASTILGNLIANGQVWLLNPAGIIFGKGARVDVAGLLATTANISNTDFLAGNYHFVQPADWSRPVINEGYIRAADEGLVALVAPGVINNGVIEARLGKVALASGTEFTVDLYGDQLINFSTHADVTQAVVDADGNRLTSAVTNSGTIMADGGKVLLSARNAGDIVENVINMDGLIQARTAVRRGGEIVLLGGNKGVVRVSGRLDASGRSSGEKGGKIKVLGNVVRLADSAFLDASGDAGGGEILIGGNYQGKGPEQNAWLTVVEKAV